jgi:hypothetical protein
MRKEPRRPGPASRAPALAGFVVVLLASLSFARAALLAPRPGPIDRPYDLAVADFDRDGWLDLALADFESGVVQILINQQDGTFAPHPLSPIALGGGAALGSPTTGPIRLGVADLDPNDVDGDQVANAADDCPNVYNPANFPAGCSPVDPVTGQCDSDGNGVGDACQVCADTACQNLLDTDGDGVPDYNPSGAGLDNCPNAYNPLQEDADNDGVGDACASSPDIIVVQTSLGQGSPFGIIRVRINDGMGGFQSRPSKETGAAPADLLLADFNRDGLRDMAVSNSFADYIQLHIGATDGTTFGPQQTLLTGTGPEGLAAGDFNGDGYADLAVANRTDGTVGVFVNQAGTLPGTATVTYLSPDPQRQPTRLLAGRLDGDMLDDLVVLDQGGTADGRVEVFLGQASATDPLLTTSPRWSTSLGTGHKPRAGALADLDNDGNLDLIVGDFSGGQVLIFKGAGDGTFTAGPALAGVVNPDAVAVLDYDTDQNARLPPTPDLAVPDFAIDTVALFHNDGALAFSTAPTSPVSPWKGSTGLVCTGVDLDLGQDIVLLHPSPPRLDVVSGIGNGFYRPVSPLALTGIRGASALSLATLLEDTRDDLLVTDQTGGTVTALFGNSSGVMKQGQTLLVSPGPFSSVSGNVLHDPTDYDRDGVPDLIDDCPTRYNPPGCTLTDPACAVTELCVSDTLAPTNCTLKDPLTGQCDSDLNGIGDACQLLNDACEAIDSDGDTKPDYDPNAILNGSIGHPDYDHDTIPNDQDNCPTRPNFDQKDANGNGIGDVCEVKDPNGNPEDLDGDGKLEYDPAFDDPTYLASLPRAQRLAIALDNCPGVYNPGQEDNDGDNVGNACVIRAALDNCPWQFNIDQSDTGNLNGFPAGVKGNNVGDACDQPVHDIVTTSPASGSLNLFIGDGSGSFREAAFSPQTGLSSPTSALPGIYSLDCSSGDCLRQTDSDIVVAERGAALNFGDDDLLVLHGNRRGVFQRLGPYPAQGDPNSLLGLENQRVCTVPYFQGNTGSIKQDASGLANLVVAVEPGTSTLQVYVPSNQGLTSPVGHTQALPVPPPLVAAVAGDFNLDGYQDLIALSGGDNDPNTPNVTVYLGMGNGLFFTDATFDPTGVRDGGTAITTGFVDLAVDSLYRDVILFNGADGVPTTLINILPERADIDGSGRVDGFDLAVLARAFGSSRGEDFTLQPDGTLLQSGSGYARVVLGSGIANPGQDLPNRTDGTCDRLLQPVSGVYGLPPDINLDGVVDGTDLAILASRFGLRF